MSTSTWTYQLPWTHRYACETTSPILVLLLTPAEGHSRGDERSCGDTEKQRFVNVYHYYVRKYLSILLILLCAIPPFPWCGFAR